MSFQKDWKVCVRDSNVWVIGPIGSLLEHKGLSLLKSQLQFCLRQPGGIPNYVSTEYHRGGPQSWGEAEISCLFCTVHDGWYRGWFCNILWGLIYKITVASLINAGPWVQMMKCKCTDAGDSCLCWMFQIMVFFLMIVQFNITEK